MPPSQKSFLLFLMFFPPALYSSISYICRFSNQPQTQGNLFVDLWSLYSLYSSLCLYSSSQFQTTLAPLNTNLCLFNSVRPLGSVSVPLLTLWPGNCLHTVNWGNSCTYLVYFPFLEDHSHVILVQYLKNIFYFFKIWFSSHLRKEGKSGPFTQSWLEVRFPVHALMLLSLCIVIKS